jgi:hypothetical protein
VRSSSGSSSSREIPVTESACRIFCKVERLLFSVAQQPKSGLGHRIVEVSISHTTRHTHTPGMTPLNE